MLEVQCVAGVYNENVSMFAHCCMWNYAPSFNFYVYTWSAYNHGIRIIRLSHCNFRIVTHIKYTSNMAVWFMLVS